MKINYLTINISDASGGGMYDKRFLELIKSLVPTTKVIEDAIFFNNTVDGNFLRFNCIYKKNIDKICSCDYLVLNSRLYTRFLFLNYLKFKNNFPDTKIIMIHHHNNYMTHRGLLYYFHKYYELKFLKASNEIIIPNQYVIDQLNSTVPLKKVVYLPTAFLKKQYEISLLNNKRILFVGNIEKRKGIEFALKAFSYFHKQYSEYCFSIVGNFDKNDKYYRKLISFIHKEHLENHVHFEGRVNENQLDYFYSHSDMFLFPSLHEGYGMVLIEAMGRGLPVIAFDNSAIPYTVKSGINGIIVRNCDWKTMGYELTKLADDNKKLSQLQQGALSSFNSAITISELCDKTLEYIRSWCIN